MSLSEETPAITEDGRGQRCPYPNLMVKKAVKAMNDGEVLDFWVDYEPAIKESLPTMCERAGWQFEVARDEGDSYWHFYIKK